MELLKLIEGIRTPFLNEIMSLVTMLGDETFFMIVGMTVMWCISKKWGFRLMIIGLAGTGFNQLLKYIFLVPRPWVLDPTFTIVESAREGAGGYSFPSGHTHSAVSVFGTLAMWLKNKWATVICIALIAVVAFSRMYLGVHTPMDVGVSLVLGGALVVILCKLLDRTEHSGKGKAAIAIGLLALIAAVLAYMYLAPVTERNMPEVDLHGKESLWKLLGAATGLVLAWFVDERWTHFDTEAPLWGQLVKLLGGVVIVVAVKSGLKPVLVALMGDVPLAHALRYFLMAAAGAALWPMTFRFYAGKQ